MKKVIVSLIILLLYLGNVFCEQTLSNILEEITYQPEKIAILYIENATGEREDYLAKKLEEVLINKIKEDKKMDLIPQTVIRENIKKLGLNEIWDILSLISSEDILKLGKLINVDKLIIVSIERYSEELTKYRSKVYIEGNLELFNIKEWHHKTFTAYAQTDIEGKRKYYEAINNAIIELVTSLYNRSCGIVEEEKREEEKYIGNIKSKMVHSSGCNHLPKENNRKIFNSLEAAFQAGYKPCVICFPAFYPSTEKAEDIEIILSQYISGIIEQYYRVMYDEEKLNWINEIGNKIVNVSPRKNLRYVFNILDTDQVNAFAAGSGYIYITKGLLDIIESEDELAAVLSHEIAHNVRKHAVSQYRRNVKLSILGTIITGGEASILADFASFLITSGYSRKYEYEADQVGLKYMLEGGYDSYGFISLLNKLQDLYKVEPSKLEIYFSTHPPIKDRIKRIENFSKKREELINKLSELYHSKK